MRKHIVIDKITGVINSIQRWGDDREFSIELLSASEELVTIADGENPFLKPDCFKYDHLAGAFIEFTPVVSLPKPSDVDILKLKVLDQEKTIDYILATI